MKNIVLLDTSCGSLNKGDEIIMKSVRNELSKITEDSFTITLPTHTPAFTCYQNFNKNIRALFVKNADYKFICGTNLLSNSMVRPWPLWNINVFNAKPLKGSILVAVGNRPNSKNLDIYTKYLYRSVLSHKFVHSVRDQKTKELLEDIGIKAINTGCATMWGLTNEFCEQIPIRKSNDVVFTLTYESKDRVNDLFLIKQLLKNYRNVYFWPQAAFDLEYYNSLNCSDDIKVISPSLESFSSLLGTDIDYVGVRLHGGIYAMQHKKRTIIIGIDNRAREINQTYNINLVERSNLFNLESFINSEFNTKINLNIQAINDFLNQFK
jgi:polysaccharide pyruvyl transferase WcaK-like protein